MALVAAVLAVTTAGCGRVDVDALDEVYYRWDDRRLFCAVGIDEASDNPLPSIEAGLDRAAARGEVLQLFTHRPGKTVSWAVFEAVLAGAAARGLRFLTYPELGAGGSGGGLALSIDDSDIEAWTAARPMLAQYGARVTFFVTRYYRWTDDGKAKLRALASHGHAVEAHARDHLRAPDVVDARGLAAYLRDEALPSIDELRADGYPVTSFAYPFGARTRELDAALLEHVTRIRSVSFSHDGPAIVDPCPE